ncbi:LOW QUALITY PROTEIN: endothelial cell-specific molecule 1 [Notamacropus eugenii]|uniref:LOW QUALITY PROTEIN: endothelial cell-specific molecule 1 n=1 Tax=Notamacropus eugenii TaxID=9315 RepID=UPI003B67ADA4
MTAKHAGNPAYKTHPLVARCSATSLLLDGCSPQPGPRSFRSRVGLGGQARCAPARASTMKGLWLLLSTLLIPAHLMEVSSRIGYAVDCPEQCDPNHCKSSQNCKQTVLDDCGCCRVCAASLGGTCYRTVSGMDGAKCGPGLYCHFSNQEDAFGEEFGICKECPYGTYGMECKQTCTCSSGICDKVIGKCLKFHFFQASRPSKKRLVPSSDPDMASGDGNAVKDQFMKNNGGHPSVTKWLKPR